MNRAGGLGYRLLGRVIERASGRDFGAFVRDEILATQGIRAVRLGKTRLEGRAPGEVRYDTPGGSTGPSVFAIDEGRDVPRPYGDWNLEAMDAHGGWIASAIDLVRFASALDDEREPRMLGPDRFDVLSGRPEGDAVFEAEGTPRRRYDACGWQVVRWDDDRRFNAWRTGSLPGTSAPLVRRQDGFCWAVLFHTRHEGEGAISARPSTAWCTRPSTGCRRGLTPPPADLIVSRTH